MDFPIYTWNFPVRQSPSCLLESTLELDLVACLVDTSRRHGIAFGRPYHNHWISVYSRWNNSTNWLHSPRSYSCTPTRVFHQRFLPSRCPYFMLKSNVLCPQCPGAQHLHYYLFNYISSEMNNFNEFVYFWVYIEFFMLLRTGNLIRKVQAMYMFDKVFASFFSFDTQKLAQKINARQLTCTF